VAHDRDWFVRRGPLHKDIQVGQPQRYSSR
jgi:hypothetical protein